MKSPPPKQPPIGIWCLCQGEWICSIKVNNILNHIDIERLSLGINVLAWYVDLKWYQKQKNTMTYTYPIGSQDFDILVIYTWMALP